MSEGRRKRRKKTVGCLEPNTRRVSTLHCHGASSDGSHRYKDMTVHLWSREETEKTEGTLFLNPGSERSP